MFFTIVYLKAAKEKVSALEMKVQTLKEENFGKLSTYLDINKFITIFYLSAINIVREKHLF